MDPSCTWEDGAGELVLARMCICISMYNCTCVLDMHMFAWAHLYHIGKNMYICIFMYVHEYVCMNACVRGYMSVYVSIGFVCVLCVHSFRAARPYVT